MRWIDLQYIDGAEQVLSQVLLVHHDGYRIEEHDEDCDGCVAIYVMLCYVIYFNIDLVLQ